MICAIDFESYYDNDISVSTMGAWHYARATDIYLVSMAGDDGLRFVGHPKDAPWDKVDGQVWLMHNAAFDLTLTECLIEKGIIPSVKAAAVYDTADMTAYLGYPRSLKEASHFLLGTEVSKDVRDKMKKKQWATMTPEFQEDVCKYALGDAENTLNLWLKHGDQWPESERRISQLTREMTMRGVPVNIQKLRESEINLEQESTTTRDLLPWHPSRPALSLHAVRDQCKSEGIWAPESFAEKEEDAKKWEDEFSDKFPWVKAIREHRKANKHLKTIRTMLNRTRPDGRMGYDLKYFGATTGRDSGSGGWNAQNLPRDVVSGVDIRSMIEAPQGETLVVCDLAQIEARCILWLARDIETLDILRTGADIYEAHARATMGYTDPRPLKDVDKSLRQLAKARCLAGDTPILTEKGYMTIKELKKNPCLRLWDGVEWINYESIQFTGLRQVSNFLGERFTADHPIFTSRGEIEIGKVFERSARHGIKTLLRRNPPSGDWSDVRSLANFVVRSLAKEWGVVCKRRLRRLRKTAGSKLLQLKTRGLDSMLKMREAAVKSYTRLESMGAGAGSVGLNSQPALGRNDEEVL